ncbi:MAG: DUF373 family protein [Halobacteriaceae archaeon]
MDTLVVVVDRTGDVGRKAGLQTPISGWEAVRSLVVDVGLADPEDSGVNTLLEALRVTRDLRDADTTATVAVVSGATGSVVGADRAIATQLDALVEEYDPESVVVVVDSAEDERVVPIVESRVAVDAVDRVVVRQARDIESTYYLLKQFLADEELRETVLVPVGIVLLVFPALLMATGLAVAVSAITAVLGLFLLYKGLGVETYLAEVPGALRDAIYSGRVSIVTYVVAAGLAAIGLFVGALGVSSLPSDTGALLVAMSFVFDSVPWLALAALAASAGQLLDEAIRSDRGVRTPYFNLPFGVVAVSLVLRGFAAYFLARGGVVDPLSVPAVRIAGLTVAAGPLSPEEHLGLFVVLGVLVSVVGIRVAVSLGGARLDEGEGEADSEEPQ